MLSAVYINKINKVFSKFTPESFIDQLKEGKYKKLEQHENLSFFLQQYALEINKDKALAFCLKYYQQSDKETKEEREQLLFQIKSIIYVLSRDLDSFKKLFERVETTEQSEIFKANLRMSYAQCARQVGDLALAYQLYDINIHYWKTKPTKEASKPLLRCYIHLTLLFEKIDNEEKLLHYISKVEELIIYIEKESPLYVQYLMLKTNISFKRKKISPAKAIKTFKTVNKDLLIGKQAFNIYMLRFLEANNDFEEAITLAKKLLKDKENIPALFYLDCVLIYLKCIYKEAKHELFLKEINKYYSFLSSEKNLKNDFLKLLDKKKKILEKENQLEKIIELQEDYIFFQKQIVQKNNKLKLEITEVKLKVREKELELNFMKEQSNTNEKINQLLNEKNESLEKFASTTAHDLKSPIKTISMFIGMLENSLKLSKDEKEMFDYIVSSSKRLNVLIDDLLIFSNKGSFSNSLSVDLDLNEIILKVKENLKSLIDEKGATITVVQNLPSININASAMMVLFQNLLNNALKFSKPKLNPYIHINYCVDKEFLKISVEDNGLGIGKEDLKKIFTPFERSVKAKNIEGSGLGLATCMRIVQAFQGKIKVKSRLGTGSQFTIFFPIQIVLEK